MLKQIILTIGFTAAIYVLWFLYAKYSYRPAKPDGQGRIMIKPGPMSWVLGMFSIFLVLFCLGAAIMSSFLFPHTIFIWIFLGPPSIYLMGYLAYVITWSRIKASDTQLEYRGLKGWRIMNWEDVTGIAMNHMMGPQLKLVSRTSLPIWAYGYGSVEMAELFLSKNKTFETS